jgi:hypothetical protein
MPPPMEPTLAAFPNPFIRYFAATRPPFLSVTFAACLIGLATAALDGAMLRPLAAFFTVFFALVAHAGINVLNDYYDALNGTDAANTERQFPFTGGSRFIQNGVLSLRGRPLRLRPDGLGDPGRTVAGVDLGQRPDPDRPGRDVRRLGLLGAAAQAS